MITTSSSVTIQKTLRSGIVTNYTTDKVSVFITNNGSQKRYNATSITNATTNASGLIVFTGVPLDAYGSYSLYVTAESVSDLDTNGVSMVKLGSGYIKRIPIDNTLVI
jgi:hypothetical protein